MTYNELARFDFVDTFYQGGNLKLSPDGEIIFCIVSGGVRYLRHNQSAPRYERLMIEGNPFRIGQPGPFNYGTNFTLVGSTITNSVPLEVETNSVRYRCEGWLGEGSIPGTGSTNYLVAAIADRSTIRWQWTPTHYRLVVSPAGNGSIDYTDGWVEAGASVTLTATAVAGNRFTRWAGEVPSSGISNATLTVTMDQARRIAAIFVPVQEDQASVLGEWPTFGRNNAHTGYTPGNLDGFPFQFRWKVQYGGGSARQPIVADGKVFLSVGAYYSTSSIRAFDANAGRSLWTYPLTPGSSINQPTYADGSVFMQRSNNDTDSHLWCFNANTGQTNWRRGFQSQGQNYMAPVVTNGIVYANTGYYSELSAYNVTNGAPRFSARTLGSNGCNDWTPAYHNGKLYLWVNGYFSEHNALTGATNWILTNATENEFLYNMERTLAVAENHAYFTSKSNLFSVDLSNRQNAWSVKGTFDGTPAVAHGTVFVITNSAISAFSTNGVFMGEYRSTNFASFDAQPIITDDAVIAAGSYGTYIFNRGDFSIRQYISSYNPTAGYFEGAQVCLADNTLYISTVSNLVAYAAGNYSLLSVTNSGGARGTPTPYFYGVNHILSNRVVSETVSSPIAGTTGTRYAIAGWTGTGSVPSSGTSNFVSFVMTNDSVLTWNWKTQYFLTITSGSNGSVNIANTWQDSQTAVTAIATASNYYHFTSWSGGISATNPTLQLLITGPLIAAANFAPNLVTNGVPEWWLAQHNLPLTDAAAMTDSDADGMLNWEEYRTGTNPLDPTSVLFIVASKSSSPGTNFLTLRWPATAGRTYRLLIAPDLDAQFSIIASNIQANPPTNTLHRTISNSPSSFFKIGVE